MEIQADRMAEETVMLFRRQGQALLEVALVLPVLLFLLYGIYSSTRILHLKTRAESAVFAEAIRTGRRLPGIEQQLSRSISSERDSVSIRSDLDGKTQLAPVPFPSLAGRTVATVEVLKGWEEIENPRWLPSAKIERYAEASVDCWEGESPSGKKIRGAVQGIVVLGSLR